LSLDLAAALAVVKAWPGSIERASPSPCRPSLTTTRHDGVEQRQVGTEGWSSIEQRDGAGRKSLRRAAQVTHAEQRGGKFRCLITSGEYIGGQSAKYVPKKGGIINELLKSPLAGSSVKFKRYRGPWRKVDV